MPELLPQEIHHNPIGSLEELKAANMSPRAFGSCSEPGNGNVGCSRWWACTMSYRGTRPHNHAVRITKSIHNGSGVVEVQRACFEIVEQTPALEANETRLKIVANEGEEYTQRGTEPNAAGKARLEANPQAMVTFIPYERTVKVEKFPAPMDNPELRRMVYSAKTRVTATAEREAIMAGMTMGDEITEHMDLRHLYGREKGTRGNAEGGEGEAASADAPRRPGRPPKRPDEG